MVVKNNQWSTWWLQIVKQATVFSKLLNSKKAGNDARHICPRISGLPVWLIAGYWFSPLSRPVLPGVEAGQGWDGCIHSFSSQTTACTADTGRLGRAQDKCTNDHRGGETSAVRGEEISRGFVIFLLWFGIINIGNKQVEGKVDKKNYLYFFVFFCWIKYLTNVLWICVGIFKLHSCNISRWANRVKEKCLKQFTKIVINPETIFYSNARMCYLAAVAPNNKVFIWLSVSGTPDTSGWWKYQQREDRENRDHLGHQNNSRERIF